MLENMGHVLSSLLGKSITDKSLKYSSNLYKSAIVCSNEFMQTKLYSHANVIESLGQVMGRSGDMHE